MNLFCNSSYNSSINQLHLHPKTVTPKPIICCELFAITEKLYLAWFLPLYTKSIAFIIGCKDAAKQVLKFVCVYVRPWSIGISGCLYSLQNAIKFRPRLPKVSQGCMQFHEIAGISMSLHAVARAVMQFHELVCSSFLCLSSSQEFRSACFSIQFDL